MDNTFEFNWIYGQDYQNVTLSNETHLIQLYLNVEEIIQFIYLKISGKLLDVISNQQNIIITFYSESIKYFLYFICIDKINQFMHIVQFVNQNKITFIRSKNPRINNNMICFATIFFVRYFPTINPILGKNFPTVNSYPLKLDV